MTPQRQAEATARRTEERLRLVADELNHRVKNTLATVQAIVRQTLRTADSLTAAGKAIDGRLVALGQAHEALTRRDWESSELSDVIRGTVRAHRDRPDRFHIEGPEVHLGSRPSLAVAMAIHELCTNAVKHGALSVAAGKVEITWSLQRDEAARLLHLRWQELGGPCVSAPTHQGFGSILIEKALAADLRGVVQLRYEPGGVICLIKAELPPALDLYREPIF